ncbi:hypothetical protein HYH03_006947 [Edaphochlamys debaryana]|uniref:Bulb-type lectin domain-containing protein n=1 Tax=Edaphochlamys debaryana TaxID=47281 RepID=A0A835Y4H6_9CHLO|nr:hypothetical protein HYH03_006947 [Edaphochlamys debaryana]|eukprot:KAG2495014.1 hypothetical protein HYH03_006947 [Edaphochlamys debaryana]
MMAAHSRRPAGLGACIMLALLMALPSVIQGQSPTPRPPRPPPRPPSPKPSVPRTLTIAANQTCTIYTACDPSARCGLVDQAAGVQKRYNIENNTLGEDCAALGTPPTVIEGSTCRDWFFFDFDWYTDKANLMSSRVCRAQQADALSFYSFDMKEFVGFGAKVSQAAFLLAANGTWSVWAMNADSRAFTWRFDSSTRGYSCPHRAGPGNAPYTLSFLNYKNVTLVNRDGKAVWSSRSMSDCKPPPTPPPRRSAPPPSPTCG